MKPLTNQQIINRVATHLFKQRKQALDGTGGCVYLSPDGLQCAVGCLIPKGDYRPDMDEKTLSVKEMMEEPSLKDLFDKKSYGLLCELQDIHDGFSDRQCHYWARRLRGAATDFGLKVPPAVIKEEKRAAA